MSGNVERLTFDDLPSLRRLLPSARMELERMERRIVQLQEEVERLRDAKIEAAKAIPESALHTLERAKDVVHDVWPWLNDKEIGSIAVILTEAYEKR